MPIRQANAPTPYLFTDERVEEGALLRAVRRLRRGAAVIFRHYGIDDARRAALFQKLRKNARRRGVCIMLAGPEPCRFADCDGWHLSGRQLSGRRLSGPQGGSPRRVTPLSASAHRMADLAAAKRAGARAVFISPVFATRSHKGARVLGPIAYQHMARRAQALGLTPLPLGGMTSARARMLKAKGFGAIDGLVLYAGHG